MNYKAQLKWWVTFIEDLTLVSRQEEFNTRFLWTSQSNVFLDQKKFQTEQR